MHLVVFGGGGKVARHVARLRGANTVTSVVRNDAHLADLKALGATPAILSLEDASTAEITKLLSDTQADAVLFSAGAGGKGAPERTRLVDYDGALKVFEACRLANVSRLVMISAVDSRDVSKPPPAHYSPESVEASRAVWEGIGRYMQAKYDADKALHGTQLAFTILRPGRLTEEPAAGAQVGRTQMGTTSRELVAQTVWAVLDQPGSAGLTLDVLDGQGVLKDEVEKAVKERVDAWTG